MKALAILFAILMIAPSSIAATLATCVNPEGHAYYNLDGGTTETQSGWTKDKVSKGVFSLQLTDSGYDLLFVDARKAIFSSRGDGGNVILMSHSAKDAVILVNYQKEGTIEIYKFFEDGKGGKKFAMFTSRTYSAPDPKSSLMVGDCSFVDFNNIKEISQRK